MAEFDFVEEYRKLQPLAERDIVTARNAAFTKAKTDAEEKTSRVLDLAYFAFGLPHRQGEDAETWFLDVLRTDDSTFSLQQDSEEAARIAALVLRSRLIAKYPGTAVSVHAAAFAGKRSTVDNHALSLAAKQTLHDLVRKRGIPIDTPKIVGGKVAGVADLIKKYSTEGTDSTDVEVFDAIAKDYNAQIKQLLTSGNNVIEKMWSENRRLAEEVDLLWWHLGQQSFLLDLPLESVPAAARPIVIGADLAAMVSSLPGPYGVYGIARRALGADADKAIKLSEGIKAIDPKFTDLVAKSTSDYAVAPVHGALAETLLEETPVLASQFKKKTNLSYDVKLTALELAIQTYHEALLLRLNWLR
ncbi:GTPase-associated system all-helical protein GASH [Mesorhizobium sp. M1B.F.Ca.ET.045.04.1.1]|uniref:GTPase-associated system all-helical protein GASH n=1 Tax=Mesorhizobium sp. M1B.F.Ca.ET.045.04.1.1 TaxID=2493673 RepID=UPI000F74E682|nr:GTPase-associated system all-helical protein GASH [Mesorhizobium sp. M1B.F.Ca.ET.045.04.1.1]AZO30808.1 hypothetical protein EJ071_27700 [Mesorhizobium sp. M1B.F.Ca.ET.045.04.1.1]